MGPAQRYTAHLLARGGDTFILGCTHYPFLAQLIGEVVGSNIALVDTGEAVARQLHRRIQTELPARAIGDASAQFLICGDVEQASRIMPVLCADDIAAQQLPRAYL